MAAIKGVKKVGQTFPNESEIVRVIYDFAVDGGATGDLDLIEAVDDIVITKCWAKVITAVTSSSTLALSAGIASDKDALIDSVDKASLIVGAILKTPMVEGTPNTFAMPMKLAAGEKITQTIETTAALTGKVEYCFEITRF